MENVEGFRTAVMNAKKALVIGAGAAAAGADKGAAGSGDSAAAQVQMLRILCLFFCTVLVAASKDLRRSWLTLPKRAGGP
jgi:hypothetical protein